jgi:hypothetical protein
MPAGYQPASGPCHTDRATDYEPEPRVVLTSVNF